jgi:hypothetical protein
MTVYHSLPVLFALLASFSFGQSTIDLCGKVTNAAGSPVSGVTIKLQKANLTTQSATDGSYCINSNAGVSRPAGGIALHRECFVSGKKLIVTLVNGDRFNATLFDLRGRTLWDRSEPVLAGGSREMMLPLDRVASQSGMLRVSLGSAHYLFRFAACDRESFVFSRVVTPSTNSNTLSKSAAPKALPVLDTLVATGSGFATNNKIRLYVYKFTDTIDFALGIQDTFSEARQQVVHRVNDYRGTLGLKRYIWNRAKDACVDTQAQMDFTSNTAHGAFRHCGEWGQCECPGWGGSTMLAVANTIVTGCLQSMWDEGPGGGHHDIMASTGYSKMACGFYYNASGKTMWATQDYF